MWKRKFRLMEGADDNKGTGSGDGGNKGVTKEQFDQLFQTVGQLAQGIQALSGSVAQINERTAFITNDNGTESGDDEEDEISSEDLEQMSRAQFMQHIAGSFGKELDRRFKSLDEQFKAIGGRLDRTDTIMTVNDLKTTKKDLLDWKEEIAAELQKKPHLSIEDAYSLVVMRDPEKATKLKEKYEGKPQGKEKISFGGFTPGSGQEGKPTNMDAKDAQEAAWNEVMGNVDLESLTGEAAT